MINEAPDNYDAQFKEEVKNNLREVEKFYKIKRKVKGIVKIIDAKHWHEPISIFKMADDAGLKEHYEQGYKAD
jgi:hypothetical protein